MIEFWAGVAGLLLLATIFVVFPSWFMRSGHRKSVRQDNLDWFTLRNAEIQRERGDKELLEEASLRLLEDRVDAIPDTAGYRFGRWGGWLILPVAVGSLGVYSQLGGLEDLRLTRAIQSFDEQTADTDVHALMADVAARAAQRPENLHYQAMLGRYYMSVASYSQAREVYLGLVEQSPTDASALALAAQASYLADGRKLNEAAQLLAERALNTNPGERTALGLLAMVAFERQQFRAAINYWQRLQALEQPGSSGSQLIQDVIGRAQLALGEPGEAVPITPTGLGLTVQVEAPSDLETGPNAVLFVLARNPEANSRMPVAVQRLPASEFPLVVRLDDSDSMAGQKISELERVMVVARISANGQPGEEHALWQGQLGPLVPSTENVIHKLPLRAKEI